MTKKYPYPIFSLMVYNKKNPAVKMAISESLVHHHCKKKDSPSPY
jgi:hypothetical protein